MRGGRAGAVHVEALQHGIAVGGPLRFGQSHRIVAALFRLWHGQAAARLSHHRVRHIGNDNEHEWWESNNTNLSITIVVDPNIRAGRPLPRRVEWRMATTAVRRRDGCCL